MKQNKGFAVFIAILGIALIIIGFMFLIMGMRRYSVNYNDSCRKLGGVPVHQYGATNCWKEGGYIDVIN